MKLARAAALPSAIVVACSVGGSATNGLDRVALSRTVTIPARKRSVNVTVQLVDEFRHEGDETLDVSVVPGADCTQSLASSSRITIVDSDRRRRTSRVAGARGGRYASPPRRDESPRGGTLMRDPRPFAAVAAVVAALVCAPTPRASAAPVVTATTALVPDLICQSGILLSSPVFHAKRDDKAGPTPAGFTSYDESVSTHADDPGGPSVTGAGNINQPNVVIGRMTSDSSVQQRSTVTSGTDTVVVASSASAVCVKTRVVENCCFSTIASARTRLAVQIDIASPCRYVISGSISGVAAPDGSAFASLTLTGDGTDGGVQLSGTSSVSKQGTFDAGRVELSLSLLCDLGSVSSTQFRQSAGSEGRASWNVTLSLSPAPAPGVNDIFWTKPASGTFVAATNWSPSQVPLKDTTHSDNAVFAVPGRYTVDLGVPARAKALGPRRTLNRLEVLRGDVTLSRADVKADELSLADPSLVVDTGRLNLSDSHLETNSATVGDLHATGAEVQVVGAGSRWNCLGRLRIGGSGGNGKDARVTASQGGTVVSAETLVGDGGGGQGGIATIAGAGSTWDTGNASVGFTSDGFLDISDGASVTSGAAVVGMGLAQSGGGQVNVSGVGAGGVRSSWTAQRLSVGMFGATGIVDVSDGGSVTATNVTIGELASPGGSMTVSGRRDPGGTESHLSCVRLTVGHAGGTGGLLVGDGGAVEVVNDMEIGDVGTGEVVVSGSDPSGFVSQLSVGGAMTVGDRAGGAGTLEILDHALVTSGTTIIGSLTGSAGTVFVESGGSLLAGDTVVGSLGGLGVLVIIDAVVGVAGDLTVGPTGALLGNGTVLLNGTVHLDGAAIVGVGVAVIKRRGSPRAGHKAPPGGTLKIDGSLVVGPTGVITAKAAGALPDQLVVTGTATLGGTLVLQFMNGFAPKTGDSFEVFHANGTVTGAFATVDVRGLAPGAEFDVATSGGAITATAKNDAVALPTVSVRAVSKKMLEKSKKKGALTISRSGSTAAPLTVSYEVSGTAANGVDYVQLPGVVTIPARKKSVKVTVQLVDDPFRESAETIDVAIVPGATSTQSLASTARITIVDND